MKNEPTATQTRQEQLNAFLSSIDASSVASAKISALSYMEVYQAKGRVFIVNVFHESRVSKHISGFDIYIPATKDNSVKATFEAVENYINS